MDFKKFAGQANTFITRAVQYTEEKLGNAEKTEFDTHYDELVRQTDAIKLWTEKILSGAQAVLIPNPGNRVEDMLFEKLEKRRPNRLSNAEHLGLDMEQAAREFGVGTGYGGSLMACGSAQQKVGLAERDLVGLAVTEFIAPLQRFLDNDMRAVSRERALLDNKRLDLDAAKGRLKKARTLDQQQAAEAEVRKCQAEFDRQMEIAKLLMEGVRSTQASHSKHVRALVAAQKTYHKTALQAMEDLQRQLSEMPESPPPPHRPTPPPHRPTPPPARPAPPHPAPQ